MTSPATFSERALRTLAGIVSERRADVPAHGLPMSLLSDLTGQIRCDVISFEGFDSDREETWFRQSIPGRENPAEDPFEPAHWVHYWDCQPCSYPDRTGDLRTVLRIPDFYSAREWHSTGMYRDLYRPKGFEHELMLSLPAGPSRRPGRARACGCSCSAGLAATSARPTAICSRCCARTCIRPTWTPSAAVTPPRSSPPGTGSC